MHTLKALLLLIMPACCFAKPSVLELEFYEGKSRAYYASDSIVEKLTEVLNFDEKFLLSLGSEDDKASHVSYLKEDLDYQTLVLDKQYQNESENLHQEYLSKDNILLVLKKHTVPSEFDILFLSLDGMEYFIWEELAQNHQPKLVITNFNASLGPTSSELIGLNKEKGKGLYGTSLSAFCNLGDKLDYALVYIDKEMTNLYFIRKDVLRESSVSFNGVGNINFLVQKRKFPFSGTYEGSSEKKSTR